MDTFQNQKTGKGEAGALVEESEAGKEEKMKRSGQYRAGMKASQGQVIRLGCGMRTVMIPRIFNHGHQPVGMTAGPNRQPREEGTAGLE
ncbi:hypothetical protein VULLAG_LOCUS4859 [Vulpes lagopus]